MSFDFHILIVLNFEFYFNTTLDTDGAMGTNFQIII